MSVPRARTLANGHLWLSSTGRCVRRFLTRHFSDFRKTLIHQGFFGLRASKAVYDMRRFLPFGKGIVALARTGEARTTEKGGPVCVVASRESSRPSDSSPS